jgi:acyl dehydratase
MTPRWEEVSIGERGEAWTVGPVDLADFVRYAGASGDFNRLHYDAEHAREAGFDGVFAQGMFDAGVLGAYAVRWLGPEGVRRFEVRFLEVVWPGDTLTCTGEIVGKHDAGDERIVEVALRCTRQTGEAVLSGSATFAL